MLALKLPIVEQFGILEDFDDHTGAEERRGGPERTDGGLQLGQTGFLLLGILANHGSETSTLSVDTKVLGEGKAQGDVVAISNEFTNGVGIIINGTRGITQVGGIHDDGTLVLLAEARNLVPLSMSGIHTGGVVGADVEEEGRVLRSRANGILDGFEVQGDAVIVQIGVGVSDGAALLEEGKVSAPSGIGNVQFADALGLSEELTEHLESAGSGDTLTNGDTILKNGLAVSSKSELDAEVCELWNTAEGRIFVVVLSIDSSLSFTDSLEDVGLSVLITVGADA